MVLTFFATITKLCEVGALAKIEIPLEPSEQPNRLFFATAGLQSWFSDHLPNVPRFWDSLLDPPEQVEGLLHRYVAGLRLSHGADYHCLKPAGNGVWEFKTPDTRIFGWFVAMDVYVGCFGHDANLVKKHNLYPGFRDQVVRVRAGFGLPYVQGEDPDAVLSIQP